LFRSEGQARLLAELFLSGDDELSISDLAQRAGVAYGSAHREVVRLIEAGLLAERTVGKSRLVRPDDSSPLAGPVRALLVVSAGPVPLLAAALKNIAGVQSAFLFGSFAARLVGVTGAAPSDIDLMVVGTPEPMDVYDACRRVGDSVGRPVNPTIMTRAEWDSSIEDQSGFLSHVLDHPRIPVFGEQP
jgi:hypothetical protein